MTTIGIISDTHSTWDDRYVTHLGTCNEIWHAGDIGDDDTFQKFLSMGPRLRAVCGNIDSGLVRRLCPERLTFDIEGVKVMLTHIGGYPGHYAPGIRHTLIAEQPKLFIAGHSHLLRVIYDKELDLLHINPGAAGKHGWQRVRTLIRLIIDGSDIRDLEVIELGKT